jgi:hypothetical protein
MSDAHIAGRKDMKQEQSDEFIRLDRHGLLCIAVGVVSPAEGNLAVVDLEDTVITDGDSVGISAQVL